MVDYTVTEIGKDIDFDRLPFWDVVVVGAGPAGMAAALTTAHRGLTTLVIEAKEQAGGQPALLYAHKRIIDVPGFPDGITGEELSARVYRQARAARVQFRFSEELMSIEDTTQTGRSDSLKRVVTTGSHFLCRKVILAIGLLHFPRRLPVLDALDSPRVHYHVPPTADYEDARVVIVGGGDSAVDAAAMVLERNGIVELIVRHEPTARAEMLDHIRKGGASIRTSTELVGASLRDHGLALQLTDGTAIECAAVIVQIGFLSATETFARLCLRMKADGSVAVDPYFETSRNGIFAVGDVHGDIKLIAVAWAEGIQAAIYAFREITSPYWLSEKRLHDRRIALIGEKMAEAADRAHPDVHP